MSPLVTTIEVNGNVPPAFGTDPLADVENTTDIEIAGGICINAQIYVYSAANNVFNYYDAVSEAINDGVIVLSTSWGLQEELIANETGLGLFDQLFQLGISMGTTITTYAGNLGSSDGDTSVSSSTNPLPVPIPHVHWPACSPYVVACGGTSLVGLTETAWSYDPNNSSNGAGGGGKSRYELRPAYQSASIVPAAPRYKLGNASGSSRPRHCPQRRSK